MKNAISAALAVLLYVVSFAANAGLFSSTESELNEATRAVYAEVDMAANVTWPFGKHKEVYTSNFDALDKGLRDFVSLSALREAGLITVVRTSKPLTPAQAKSTRVFGTGFDRTKSNLTHIALTPKGASLLRAYHNKSALVFAGVTATVVEFTEPVAGPDGVTTHVKAQRNVSGLEPELKQLVLTEWPDYEKRLVDFTMVKTNKGWRLSQSWLSNWAEENGSLRLLLERKLGNLEASTFTQ